MKPSILISLTAFLICATLFSGCGGGGGGKGGNNGNGPGHTITVQPVEEITHNVGGVEIKMRKAPGGMTFPISMYSDTATIDYAFWIGETEVTYELWEKVHTWATAEERKDARYYFQNTGKAGSHYGGETTEPVTEISWRDAIVWCNALTEYYNEEKGTNWDCVYTYEGEIIRDSRDENAVVCDNVNASPNTKGFRLPASKEWELAARYINGIDWLPYNHASGDLSGTCYPPEQVTTTQIGDYTWYAGNSGGKTHPVADKGRNGFGLFDMSGNVWELCFDRHWKDENMRVKRGGYYGSSTGTYSLMVSYEDWAYPYQADATLGFRFARTD